MRAAAPTVSFAVEPEYFSRSSYALLGFSLLTKGALPPSRVPECVSSARGAAGRVSKRVTAATSLASSGLMLASLAGASRCATLSASELARPTHSSLCARSAARTTARAAPAELQVTTVIPSARLPNGLTWSADGRTMYWIDTATNAVDAFDFDPAAGSLRNRRTVITCPCQGASVHGAVGGVPDGMTIDSDGKLWVELGESGCVVQARRRALAPRPPLTRAPAFGAQYDPATGRQLSAVALPVQRPTACTFGAALQRLHCSLRALLASPAERAHVSRSRRSGFERAVRDDARGGLRPEGERTRGRPLPRARARRARPRTGVRVRGLSAATVTMLTDCSVRSLFSLAFSRWL